MTPKEINTAGPYILNLKRIEDHSANPYPDGMRKKNNNIKNPRNSLEVPILASENAGAALSREAIEVSILIVS